MAGSSEFNKSSRASFMSVSPKPKQASILNFFAAPKQKKDSPLVLGGCGHSDSDSSFSFDLDNSKADENMSSPANLEIVPEFATQKSEVKRKLSSNFIQSSGATGIVTPRILSDLQVASGNGLDVDQDDGTGCRYSWLIDIKDENGRGKEDPDYDPRTLSIPSNAWSKFTPFEKQFWEIKSKFFDTVVFFKKGKFFELYENDADIGAKEFNLKMVDRVNMRMCGVPEVTFDFWASKFVGKGYKVAKVDQLENAVSKVMREKAEKSKAEKIIRRELTSILTSGTLVDGNHLKSDSASFCISIKISEGYRSDEWRFGVAFIDASSAKFFLTEFTDDSSLVLLDTMLAQINLKEVILEKSYHRHDIVKFIKSRSQLVEFVFLDSIKEFWDINRTAQELDGRGYFGSESSWPELLRQKFESRSSSFSAFGALISYLRTLKLDFELLSYCNIYEYDIMKQATSMIVDGQAVEHLSICSLNADQRNTLLGTIDRCNTPPGHRMLRDWILHPLIQTQDISNRQQAVSRLMSHDGIRSDICRLLKTLPDLERLGTRVHAESISIKNFVAVLNGFKSVLALKNLISTNMDLLSASIIEGLCMSIPDYSEELEFFFTSFDHAAALRDGSVEMAAGSYPELDDAQASVSAMEFKFEKYLKEQEGRLKFKPLKYRDIGKEIYQIEVPVNINPPSDYMVMSKTKAVKRYWTPDLRKMVNDYVEIKENLSAIQASAKSKLYQRFSSQKAMWRNAVNAVSTLDCFVSLAVFSKSIPEPRCQPVILEGSNAQLTAKGLRHSIVACFSPEAFVSNDIKLSTNPNEESAILLTGANMGGKSTLLRQVGLAVILAQIGSWVPATDVSLVPFDRIFTRLGANDNIIGGESTFKVELSETSKILKNATSKSLIIMDELGRGTSTFDGVSIAEAVLHYLINKTKACILFSTHYNMLCETFRNNSSVGLYFMNCLVSEERKTVTFLYKLARGVSPKSYGIHVAHMAGLPSEVIEDADKYSSEFSYSKNETSFALINQSLAMTNFIMNKVVHDLA